MPGDLAPHNRGTSDHRLAAELGAAAAQVTSARLWLHEATAQRDALVIAASRASWTAARITDATGLSEGEVMTIIGGSS